MGKSSVTVQNSGLVVSTSNRFPVDVGAPNSVSTAGTTSVVSFTRTADTNAYTAGDVIGINAAGSAGSAIHSFTAAGPSASSVFITGADLTIGLSSVTSGMSTFSLHLYGSSPTAILDNAAFDLTSSDVLKHLAVLDLPTPLDYGSSLYSAWIPVTTQILLVTTTIYAELVTNGGYTPASGTAYQLRLRTLAV